MQATREHINLWVGFDSSFCNIQVNLRQATKTICAIFPISKNLPVKSTAQEIKFHLRFLIIEIELKMLPYSCPIPTDFISYKLNLVEAVAILACIGPKFHSILSLNRFHSKNIEQQNYNFLITAATIIPENICWSASYELQYMYRLDITAEFKHSYADFSVCFALLCCLLAFCD